MQEEQGKWALARKRNLLPHWVLWSVSLHHGQGHLAHSWEGPVSVRLSLYLKSWQLWKVSQGHRET